MRLGAGIIVVLVLVLTAGCLGLGLDGSDAEPTVESPSNDTVEGPDDDRDGGNDGDDADGSDESDESNAVANEESGSADDDVDVPADLELPPGVDEDGIHDVTALLEANDAALAETGYEAEIRQTVRSQMEETTTAQTIRVDADGRMLSTHSTNVSNTDFTQEFWLEGDTAYQLHETDGEPNYSVVSANGVRSTLEPSTGIEPSLEAYAFDVAAVEDGRIVLEATNASDGGNFFDQNGAENLSATLVLDADGRIHSFEHGYDTGTSGIDYAYRLVETGDVTLEEPGWTDEAREAATMVDLSVDREDGLLAVTHEGGDPLENGTSVIVGTPETRTNVTLGTFAELRTEFEPGDTAYVAHTSGIEGAVSIGEPPSVDADPFPDTELRVTVVTDGETVEIVHVGPE